jgi:hypothetical protein
MSIAALGETACNKASFSTIQEYVDFALRVLEFASKRDNLQAIIVCQNENQYRFWQFKEDGNYNISRPINANLMYNLSQAKILNRKFLKVLGNAPDISIGDEENRDIIRRSIYTIQQCIGIALDSLPSGLSNTARKRNGDLFERFIILLAQHLNVDCTSGTVQVPVIVDGVEQLK